MTDGIRTLPDSLGHVEEKTTAVPQLRVIFSVVEGLQGTAHRLGAGELVLGRGKLFGGMALDDPRISARHVSVSLSGAGVLITDLGSTNGTLIDGERVEQAVLTPGEVLRVGGTFLQLELTPVRRDLEPDDVVLEEYVGVSPATREVRNKIRGLAEIEASVLVLGPPGAGKERVAWALHRASGRKGPLVALNCAVLTDELAASELFGHVKGAFTGAVGARAGAFRKAAGGTLLLDEIGELHPTLQAKLLRVMEERRVRPVGSDVDYPVDVRIVAATNQDLPAMVRQRRFRGDLFSRVATSVISVPPLRQRLPDVVALAQSFLPEGCRLHPTAVAELLSHPWPHNVRDLKAVISLLRPEEGVARLNESAKESLAVGRRLSAETAPRAAAPRAARMEAEERVTEPEAALVRWPDGEEERIQLLERLLSRHQGNVSAVARLLGKHGSSMRRWIKLYNIDPDRFRP